MRWDLKPSATLETSPSALMEAQALKMFVGSLPATWIRRRRSTTERVNCFPQENFCFVLSSVQLLSCVWLFYDPMDCGMPDFPADHQHPELTQTHVHWVGDAIQASHPLSSPSPPTFNRSQHQVILKWVSSSHQVVKVLEFQLQHQSFQRIYRTYFL